MLVCRKDCTTKSSSETNLYINLISSSSAWRNSNSLHLFTKFDLEMHSWSIVGWDRDLIYLWRARCSWSRPHTWIHTPRLCTWVALLRPHTWVHTPRSRAWVALLRPHTWVHTPWSCAWVALLRPHAWVALLRPRAWVGSLRSSLWRWHSSLELDGQGPSLAVVLDPVTDPLVHWQRQQHGGPIRRRVRDIDASNHKDSITKA